MIHSKLHLGSLGAFLAWRLFEIIPTAIPTPCTEVGSMVYSCDSWQKTHLELAMIVSSPWSTRIITLKSCGSMCRLRTCKTKTSKTIRASQVQCPNVLFHMQDHQHFLLSWLIWSSQQTSVNLHTVNFMSITSSEIIIKQVVTNPLVYCHLCAPDIFAATALLPSDG